jgi:hypothetical protein
VLGPVGDDVAAGFTRGWPGTLARLAQWAEPTVGPDQDVNTR